MCGRLTLRVPAKKIAELFQVPEPTLVPHFNIAPSQAVPAVRGTSAERELVFLRWGLLPHWSKNANFTTNLINARGETVAEKPSFRKSFRERRCLVVADGFYEWRTVNKKKQPYFIRFQDDRPFGIAGVWDRWQKGDAEPIESCTLITTEPNDVIKPIHDRMPVILDPKDFDDWLDPEAREPEFLQELLRSYPGEAMEAFEVSKVVNSPQNDVPECIEAVTKPQQGWLF